MIYKLVVYHHRSASTKSLSKAINSNEIDGERLQRKNHWKGNLPQLMQSGIKGAYNLGGGRENVCHPDFTIPEYEHTVATRNSFRTSKHLIHEPLLK